MQQGGRCAQFPYAEPAGLQGRREGGCPIGRGAARCVVPARTRHRPRPGRPAPDPARRWPAPAARRCAGRRQPAVPAAPTTGNVTWRSSSRASRPAATRSAVGPAPPLHRPSAPVSCRWSRIARAGGASASRRRGTSSVGGPGGRRSRSPTTSTGRVGEPHTSASPSSRSIAPATASGVAGELLGFGALHQRLQHRELQRIQPLERAQHRRLHHHPCRQLRGVVGRRHGQVGPRLEQRGQLLVDQLRNWSARVRGAGEGIRRILRGCCCALDVVRAGRLDDRWLDDVAGCSQACWQDRLMEVTAKFLEMLLAGASREDLDLVVAEAEVSGSTPEQLDVAARAARARDADPRADGAPAQPRGRAVRAQRDRARPDRDQGPRRDPGRDRQAGAAAPARRHDLPLAERRAGGCVVHEGDRRRAHRRVPRAAAATRHRSARAGGAVGGAVLHRGLPGRRALRAPRLHRQCRGG